MLNAFPYTSGHHVLPMRAVEQLTELDEPNTPSCGTASVSTRRSKRPIRHRVSVGTEPRQGSGRRIPTTYTCTSCPAGMATPTS